MNTAVKRHVHPRFHGSWAADWEYTRKQNSKRFGTRHELDDVSSSEPHLVITFTPDQQIRIESNGAELPHSIQIISSTLSSIYSLILLQSTTAPLKLLFIYHNENLLCRIIFTERNGHFECFHPATYFQRLPTPATNTID